MRWLLNLLGAIGSASSAAARPSGATNTSCVGIQAVSPLCDTHEAAYHRDVFFIGGEYVPSGNSYIVSDQMYVEKLTPLAGVALKPYPIVLISAGVPSGSVWLNTPDNRRGWASYFLEAGYRVYIVDNTANGRSGQNDVARFPLGFGSTVNITEDDYTSPQLIDPYPQARGHDQWPGNGTMGDPFFDAFFAATVPLTTNTTAQELSMRAAGCALLALVGPAFLLSHSAGATYASLMSDACPAYIRANINLEPGNVPFQNLIGNATVAAVGRTATRPWGLTNTPITYDPPVSNATAELATVEVGTDTPGRRSCFLQAAGNGATAPRTLPQIAKVPYVLFTAANSPHATYDHCVVAYLAQAGVRDITWTRLADLGIRGNGHFFHLELNNRETFDVVEREIASRS